VLISGALVLFLYLAVRIPATEARFLPSESAAYIPAESVPYADYIAENRRRIRQALEVGYFAREEQPFGPAYSVDVVVSMRAPFEIRPAPGRCDSRAAMPGAGFLLIHGLTDSPYLLSEVAARLAERYPCAYIRSLLLPGHGTVPGDLLDVSLSDWRQVVRYGVQSFSGQVSELHLIGYSNGATLAIDYLQEHPEEDSISSVILLSPGLAAAQQSIALAPLLKYVVAWASRGADRDAAKYDSLATNAAALFYQLTRKITGPEQPVLKRPVFMVVSGDDTTVDTEFAAEYFCQRATAPGSKLLWYRSKVTDNSPSVDCPGLEIADVEEPDWRFVSHSHVAISMPPDNAHYGLNGHYAICSAYGKVPELLDQCYTDNRNTVYGENTVRDESLLFQGRVVRRASFNPLFDELMKTVICFVENSCPGPATSE
jgi:alpha-beta hydrolase superfamily lysophospholipase